MQVDPQTQSQAQVFVATPDGGELSLNPGREVVARVVAAAGSDGVAKINLAGQTVDVHADTPLAVGDEIRLAVTQADATGVRLAIVTPEGTGTSNTTARGGAGGIAQQLVQELAKAGIPVTPQLAGAATQLASQLDGSSESARAVASLASRDLALSPAAAGRVTAALELAGSVGPALASLAARSPAVAAALPAGAPNTEALRSLLAPGLSSSELAVARIVQATQSAAPHGPVTLPTPPTTASPTVIQNYVSSQVAAVTQLDDLAAQNTALVHSAQSQLPAPMPATERFAGAPGLAQSALQGTARGQAAASTEPAQAAATTVSPQAAPAAAATTARANATAAAATGAANAIPVQTSATSAGAIADLSRLAVRFAPAVAAGSGVIADANAAVSRGTNTAQTQQERTVAAATIGGAVASVAGGGVDGDPMPVVTALRAFLASPGSDSDAAKLLRTIAGATPQATAQAIQTLPESESLQLAGRLLEMLPDGSKLAGPALHDLRAGVHTALDRLGSSLSAHSAAHASNESAALRSVLEQVASSDPRPAVAADAQRLLAAVDGQQILSRTATGADPGFVYFQVPLPNGGGAEVLVRREPGRRAVSFDEFRVAFLLDTQQLGTLMIELDAHPTTIRADVRTDLPAIEPWLRDRTEALMEPLAREARRQVTVTTGVFDAEPPSSLLEPRLGALQPGTNEFYA